MAAKRMVLVPAEMHQQGSGISGVVAPNLITPSVPLQPPPLPQWGIETAQQYSTYPPSALDSDMSAILQDKNLSIDVKYAKYQDAIIRHRMSSYQRQYPQQVYKRPRTIHDSVEMDVEKLLRSIPEQKKKSARMLINFLTALPQFSVNGQNEIQLNGETIENTNIIELLREFSIDRKTMPISPPKGYHQFMDLLIQSNVTPEAIGSERHRQQMSVGDESGRRDPSHIRRESSPQPSRVESTTSIQPSRVESTTSIQPSRIGSRSQGDATDASSSSSSEPLSSRQSRPLKKKKKKTSTKRRQRGRSSSSSDDNRTVWIRGVPVKEGEEIWQDYTQS